MGKGFFISKSLGIVSIVLGVGAVATIIALSVVYAQEKSRNAEVAPPDPSASGGPPANTAPSVTPPSTPANLWDRWRLPKALRPIHYSVTLQPVLKRNSQDLYVFTGNSTVSFECLEATDLILIHSKKLNYTVQDGFLVSLRGLNGSSPPSIQATWLQNTTQYLVVQLGGQLEQNRSYELFSIFTGELADDLAGFYRSEYEDEGRRVVATTQMQAADARKAFPCFDEPAMKATFSVTLIHPSSHKALSNMPEQSDGEMWNVTEFEKTPKMSTYLLAFIVSEFTSVDNTSDNVLIRIFGRPKAIDEGQGEYALKVTGPILKFFEGHYNTAYPLPKSDQVALPDFNAGAMENWGLVTYRENSLLYDSRYSSIGNKERVLTVIAHELAHQWFGNLVTLRWWNDLWLNEGFASYVEYLGADAAEPTWNIKDLLVSNEMYRVMAIDALASSHPLSFREDEINTPAQISEVFDAIAYSKGASVLRMLSEFLTEELFKEGLHCSPRSLAQAVNKSQLSLPGTIKEIMDRWTLQMGFPVVTVDTASGVLTQDHFLLDRNATVSRASSFSYTWIVPIPWMKSDGTHNMYWLTKKTDTNSDFSMAANSWLLLNQNVTGYFLVNYDPQNWAQLIQQLNNRHEAIPVLNRAQLINDAFNLARAKYISTATALDTTRYLAKERDYLPWSAALGSLGYFQLMFDRGQVFGPMKKYIQKQVTPLFRYFEGITNNWTRVPDTLMDQYNEINAISTACSYEMPDCLALATRLFEAWRRDPSNNPIPPNLRSSIYCSAIATGGQEAWDFAWEMFVNATVVSEADKIRGALACSRETWILNRYLQYTLNSTKIRRQDATSTINSIARNVVGQSLTWDFVRAEWKTLFKQYGGGSFSFSGLIQTVTQRFASNYELQQLEQFKADNADVGFGSAVRALEQALEKTKANIKWVADNEAAVLAWFQGETS
uniref:Aminopeptidase n=1 Tax=Sphenodon punctatus TaxID=8508 RepID=A0A8D0HNN1_SPHPU